MTTLTEKQEFFCREYVKHRNATRAAIAAGYSKKSAKQIGSENLTKTELKNFIAELEKDFSKSVGLTKIGVGVKLLEIIEDPETTPGQRIRALREYSLICGYYTDDIQLPRKPGEPIVFNEVIYNPEEEPELTEGQKMRLRLLGAKMIDAGTGKEKGYWDGKTWVLFDDDNKEVDYSKLSEAALREIVAAAKE